jgi:lipid-binding SYLF domain-containing protein
MRLRPFTTYFVLILATTGIVSIAGQKPARTVPPKAINQSKKAVDLLEQAMAKDARIPKALLTKAVAVLVVTDMKTFGFLIEGAGKGSGVVTRRFADGKWSPAAYIFLRAVSIRPQFNADSFNVILLFMNDKAADRLLDKNSVEFKRENAPVAGPVGEIRTDQKEVVPVADVFSYVYDEGRLQSVDVKNLLQTVLITFDNDLNKGTYGVTAADILDELHGNKPARVPDEVMGFTSAVARYCAAE